MHSLFAAFFAMIFSFGHAQTAHRSELALASGNNQQFVQAAAPSRVELAHQQFETISSYAEDSCVSCRRMNVVYDAR